jgi:hypothetical protein
MITFPKDFLEGKRRITWVLVVVVLNTLQNFCVCDKRKDNKAPV